MLMQVPVIVAGWCKDVNNLIRQHK